MRTATRLRGDSPWNGEHFASEISGGAGRDQRSAALRGFHDYNPEGQARDRAVARGKVPGMRRRARKKLRDQRAIRLDLIGETAIFWRIPPIDSSAEHGNGASGGGEGATLGGGVDAPRQAAD